MDVGKPKGKGATILFGKTAADFASLDTHHPYAWVVGPISVAKMETLTPRQQLDFVGWPLSYVDQLTKEGNQFKIAEFDFAAIPFAVRATWDGLVLALQHGTSATPESRICAEKVKRWLPELKALNYAAFAKKYGDVRVLKKIPELKAMVSSVDAFASATSLNGAFAARAFLYYTMDADELYYGNGWTYDAQGKKGGDEYLVTAMKISNIPGATLTTLDVSPKKTGTPVFKQRLGCAMGGR